MGRARKLVLGLGGGGVLVGIAGLALVPVLFSGPAKDFVVDTLEASVDADITLGEVSATVWSTFPNLEVTVSDLAIVGRGEFAGVELLKTPTLSVELDLWSVIGGEEISVRSLRLRAPSLDVRVSEAGNANYDLFIASEAQGAEPSSYRVKLDAIEVSDLSLTYRDEQARRLLTVTDFDHTATGDLTQAALHYVTQTTIGAMSWTEGSVPMLRETKWDVDVALDYDLNTGGIALSDGKIGINDLVLGLKGTLEPADDGYTVDLTYDTLDTTFKSLLSLIPSAYTAGYEDVKTGGTLALSGTAKGLYSFSDDHLPAFDLDVDVDDGWFQYPDLPGKVDNIEVKLEVSHPEGAMDLTEIGILPFRMSVAGQALTVSGRVKHPVTDPWLDLKVDGALDLAKLAQAYPMEGGTGQGSVQMDLTLRGRTSDFQAQRVDAITATGGFRAKGLTLDTLYVPERVTVLDLDIGLSPKHADVRVLDLGFGKSDVQMKGQFDNLVPYLVGQAPLAGTLKATSRTLDLVPFQGEDEETPDEGSSIVVVPADLDLELSGTAGRVLMEGWSFDDVKGTMFVREGTLRFQGVRLGIAGGVIGLAGTYAAEDTEAADVDLEVSMNAFTVRGLLDSFASLEKLVPIARSATGKLNTDFTMTTRLRSDLTPDPELLASTGSLALINVQVKPGVLSLIGDKLGGAKLSALDLSDSLLGFQIEDGFLRVKETPLRLGERSARLSGKTGVIDQTLDFDLVTAVPASLLQKTELASKLGVTAGDVDVGVHIGGTWDAPKVSLELGNAARDLVAGVADQAKAVVTEKLNEVTDDLLAKARAQGDKLVAEAGKAAARLRTEGNKAAALVRTEAQRQGDRLISEAGNNLLKKAAANEAAKKLKTEADKKAAKIEQEADKKADAIEREAAAKRDKLIAEAEGRVRR